MEPTDKPLPRESTMSHVELIRRLQALPPAQPAGNPLARLR
ncbi:MAG: hypothetical protein ABI434_18630 [Burkholderiaceae bacterium]